MTLYWPLVCDGLAALFTTVAEQQSATTKVWDRPPPNHNGGKDFIAVGWDEDGDAGSFSYARSPIGNDWLAETGEVRCALVSQTGARDWAQIRSRLFALHEALSAAVAADQTLGVLPAGSTCTVASGVVQRNGTGGNSLRLDLIVTYTTLF